MTRTTEDIGIELVSCQGAAVLLWQQNLGHKLVAALLNAKELEAGSRNLIRDVDQDGRDSWNTFRSQQIQGLRLLINYAASAISVVEYIDHRAESTQAQAPDLLQKYQEQKGARSGSPQLWAFMESLRHIAIHQDPPLIESRFDPNGKTSHLGIDSGRLVLDNPGRKGLRQYGKKRPRLDHMVATHSTNLRKCCSWYCDLERQIFAEDIRVFEGLWSEYQQALAESTGEAPHPSFVELADGVRGPFLYFDL